MRVDMSVKRIAIPAICLCLLCNPMSCMASATFDENNPFFQKMWHKFSEVSNDAIELATKDNRDSKTALEFVTLREPKYIRLLKDAQGILGNSEAEKQFDAIEDLRIKNRKLKDKIIELKKKRIAAVESSVNPLTDTKSSIDKKIANYNEEITTNESKIEQLKCEILQILNGHGLNISYDELNYFLVSAEGSELIRLMTVAENMKRIQQIIERQLQNDSDNVDLAKYYTGMYLVSLESYANAHDVAIRNIYDYRNKLKIIISEAQNNYEEAKELLKSASAQDMANIESNIKINERALEVAQMYDDLLDRRISNLNSSKHNIERKVNIARNTYKTISNGSTLISLVSSGSDEYSLLINFEMPELKNMYDGAVMSAFAEISERIKGSNN